MGNRIKAITFDLWDTVLIDDSDESKRKAASKPPKPIERRQLVKQFIEKYSPISQECVNVVYDAVDAAFRKVWHEQHITWTVRQRLSLILEGLGQTLPNSEMDELIQLHEDMELEYRPDFVPGIHEALKSLYGNYKLGVVSDTIFSPGRALRKLLADEGFLKLFDVCIFSDEFGRSKPEPAIFLAACENFGVKPTELVHVGDREHNDVAGARPLGALAVLCTAVIDRGSNKTKADAAFDNYKDLPAIIKQLDK